MLVDDKKTQSSNPEFPEDAFLIFIGHSDDATAEAHAICDLKGILEKDFRTFLKINYKSPFRRLIFWEWGIDASSKLGGQNAIVTPVLHRAQIIIFVFKERVGTVTWEELKNAQKRSKENNSHIFAFFPDYHPKTFDLGKLQSATDWATLLECKMSLTGDWGNQDSYTVTRCPDYKNIEDLKIIAFEKLRFAIGHILTPAITSDSPIPPPLKALIDNKDISFDRRPILSHSVDDLDGKLVEKFLSTKHSRHQLEKEHLSSYSDNTDRLAALGCVTDSHPTLGAFLCFAPSKLIQDKFGSCSLHMVRYQGIGQISSGTEMIPMHDNLLNLFERGLNWLVEEAHLGHQGRAGSVDRDDLEIPEICLREALANALVHRDYEDTLHRDQPTRIEVYDNRVEITSFGMLPASVSIAQLNQYSDTLTPVRKNPVIAKIFNHMAQVKLNASGISRMRVAMQNALLPPPTVKIQNGALIVCFERPIFIDSDTGQTVELRKRALIGGVLSGLESIKQAAASACFQAGYFPVMMEHYPADVKNAILLSNTMVDNADIYIGILTHQYGYVPAGYDKSITEIEYSLVKARNNLPQILFALNQDFINKVDSENNLYYRKQLEFRKAVACESVLVDVNSAVEIQTQLFEWFKMLADGFASKSCSLADESENKAREMLYVENYFEAKLLLQKAIEYDDVRKKRISEEFGFLEYNINDKKKKWIKNIWCLLSERNSYCLSEIKNDKQNPKIEIVIPNTEIPTNDKKYSGESPQIKGAILEKAVESLFRKFFDFNSEHKKVIKVRRQKSGSQYGYDIGVEIKCTVKDSSTRCHIECKYYNKEITFKDIAEKLYAEKIHKSAIDHWVLISPLANVSNDLNHLLDNEKEINEFPFNIQIWCPATNVEEFFGLVPEVHKSIFSDTSRINPKDWSDEKCEQVMGEWMLKLNPPLIFPKGWSEYIRYPENLCIGTETHDLMDRSFARNILMYCRNANGDLLPQPLDHYIDQWLESLADQVCYLLGDFGDGKSFYTYVLARRLINNWKSNQDTGWLPIRFSLKSFPDNCSSRDFLRNRLEEFGADISGWNEMKKKAKNRIIILDGFDEMSVSLEQKQVNENIGKILQCINEEFQYCKILITSRPHFFKNRKDADRLLSRAKGVLYYLASIDRKKVINHLCESIPIQNRSYVYHLEKMSDPIGIASKPLFLDMLKEVLFSLNEESSTNTFTDLNIITLYEKYIDKTLERKKELLDLPDRRITPSEIFDNLKELLGKIAEDMRRENMDSVSLVNYVSYNSKNFAELLWKITSPEESNVFSDDACSRIESRTFLSRLITGNDDEWRVKWCHRSMQEYFVASRLSRLILNVDDDHTELLDFFENIPFNYEIFEFAVEFLKLNDFSLAQKKILEVLNKSNSRVNIAGNAITLLFKLYPGSLNKIDFDWSGKRYDGAELENADLSNIVFTGSSFCYADMANVNLENTNLENCDLTGVRVEETTAVMSIWSDDNGEKLIVVYRDGIIRQWQLNPGSKTMFTTVFETCIPSECQFGIDADSMQAWLKVGDKYLFIDRQDDVWKIISQFQIKSHLTSIRIQNNKIAYVEKKENDALYLVVINLNLKIAICNKRINDAWCVVTLGDKAVAYCNSISGVYLCSFLEDENNKEQFLPFKKISCLDVYGVDDCVYFLAAGSEGGYIALWKIHINLDGIHSENIFSGKEHDSPITTIKFIDSSRLASGNSDGAILIHHRIDGDPNILNLDRKLDRKIKCKGLKIDGLKREYEYNMLSALINKSDL